MSTPETQPTPIDVPIVSYDRHPAFSVFEVVPSCLPENVERRLRETEFELAALDDNTDPDASKRTVNLSKDQALQQVRTLIAGSKGLVTAIMDGMIGSRDDWDTWEMEVLDRYGLRLHSEYSRHLRNVERRTKHLDDTGPSEGGVLLQELRIKGVTATPLASAQKEDILAKASVVIDRLRTADIETPNGFSSTSIPQTSRRLWTTVQAAVAPLSLDHLAECYLGYPVQLTHIELHVNRPGNRYFSDKYSDIGLPSTQAAGIHFDSGCGMIKAMVYLSDVTAYSGPFSYITTSNTWFIPYFRRFSGQAFPFSGVSLGDMAFRRLFMKIPESLRQISHFGSDFYETDRAAEEQMLGHERTFTSQDGDLVIFDNRGLHRGGVLPQEERIALQLQYSPRALLEKATERASHSLRKVKARIPSIVGSRNGSAGSGGGRQ